MLWLKVQQAVFSCHSELDQLVESFIVFFFLLMSTVWWVEGPGNFDGVGSGTDHTEGSPFSSRKYFEHSTSQCCSGVLVSKLYTEYSCHGWK